MIRVKGRYLVAALVLGLSVSGVGAAAAQSESAPGGCGTPAVPATPATPADPGAPGDGATPAQPAQPAVPADPQKCADDSVLSSSAQAGPDGVLGTADDLIPRVANTGFGGAAPGQPVAWALFASALVALAAGLGVRRMGARAAV